MAEVFQDKVAIVTGGASGLGQALCESLCRRGAKVIVADIDDLRGEQLAATICATGGWARFAHMDVTNFGDVQRVVSDIASEFGQLDYMFNNAAQTATRGELYTIPLEHWHDAIGVNLLGVVHGTMAAYRIMAQQGVGHIVNTGSIAGLIGFPTSIPYGATKAAVINLSLAVRIEAAERGIKVSVVCPGPIHGEERRHVNLIGIERAAQLILKGVERNKAMIIFPLLARILWGVHRISPYLLFPLGRKLVRDYRREHRPVSQDSTSRDHQN